jgi:hypothetical protein
MRNTALGIVAALGLAIGPVGAADKVQPKTLAVHEWGVLSAYNDLELANADMRAEWAGLPKFVHGQVDDRKIPIYEGPVKAPVIYFHASQAMQLAVHVDFPGGRPAVWWPATTAHVFRRGLEVQRQANTLDWQVQVKSSTNAAPQRNDVGGDRVARPPKPSERQQLEQLIRESNMPYQALPKGHWMEALRAVQADDVFINQPYAAGMQKERFIYYDGLIPRPKGLAITVAGDKVSLRSEAKHPVFDVTVVDLRNLRNIRVARLDKMEAGAEVKEVAFAVGDQTKWPAEPVAVLIKQLTKAGLHEDEARALTTVWRKDFFETEGVSVFYRLPQDIYDKLLPLTVTPKPDWTVRTLLVHHPHCEPDLAERVMALVKELDARKFEDRLEAHKRLQKLGRAAFVHLVRARKANPPLEVRMRLDKLLEEFETEAAFPK